MRSKLYTIATSIFAALILATFASAQKIHYYTAPGTSFGNYKTYRWERADKATYPDPGTDQMFTKAIDAELAKRGFTRTDAETADLVATYQIAIVQDMEWSAGHSRIPWQGMVSANVGLQGGPVGGTNLIQKGFFILDFYDVKRNQQVWQAQATKTLDDTMDMNKRDRNIQKAMGKVFKGFPR